MSTADAVGQGRSPLVHQPDQQTFRVIHSEDVNWKAFPAFPAEVRLAILVGDPMQTGPYVIRVRVPNGVRLMPHRHAEDRIYSVISGVFYIGLGGLRRGEAHRARAGQRARAARGPSPFSLGPIRRIRESSQRDRSARPRVHRCCSRSPQHRTMKIRLLATIKSWSARNPPSHPWVPS